MERICNFENPKFPISKIPKIINSKNVPFPILQGFAIWKILKICSFEKSKNFQFGQLQKLSKFSNFKNRQISEFVQLRKIANFFEFNNVENYQNSINFKFYIWSYIFFSNNLNKYKYKNKFENNKKSNLIFRSPNIRNYWNPKYRSCYIRLFQKWPRPNSYKFPINTIFLQ